MRRALANPRHSIGIAAIALFLCSCAAPINYTNPDGPRFSGCAGDTAASWNPNLGQRDVRPPEFARELRVVTFNIKFSKEIDRAILLLRSDPNLSGADILLLQEMDESGVRAIGEALGLCWVYYPATRHPQTGRNFGDAILTRYPFIEDHKVLLPRKGRFGRTRRIASAATLDVNGVAVRVYSIHLATWVELGPNARRDQARAVAHDAEHFHGPVIAAGDFNAKSPAEALAESGFDWLTADVGGTNQLGSLDHILVRKLKVARERFVGKAPDARGASDHVPVWARIVAPVPE